ILLGQFEKLVAKIIQTVRAPEDRLLQVSARCHHVGSGFGEPVHRTVRPITHRASTPDCGSLLPLCSSASLLALTQIRLTRSTAGAAEKWSFPNLVPNWPEQAPATKSGSKLPHSKAVYFASFQFFPTPTSTRKGTFIA